jgi:hypothetical protein
MIKSQLIVGQRACSVELGFSTRISIHSQFEKVHSQFKKVHSQIQKVHSQFENVHNLFAMDLNRF